MAVQWLEQCRARLALRRRFHSAATVSEMAEQCPELADGTPVTATVRSGCLTPSDLGAAEEWLAFNAFVRREGGRMVVCPFCRGVVSSEAETRGAAEGFGGEPSSEVEIAPRVRGGSDGPHCVLGPWIELL